MGRLSMPLVLEPSWIGRRVTVRRVIERAPDGRLHQADVVGDLLGLDAQTAVVEGRTGPVEVPLALVTAARLAPPSTADELALEEVIGRGLRPVETATLGGWVLRADHGFTRRANSVLPLRAPGMPLPEALRRAHEWYAERGLPLRIAAPVEARRLLDAELGERGWEIEIFSHVMTARLDHVSDAGAPGVALATVPDAAWLGLYRGGEGANEAGRALLTRHDRVVFAALSDGADVVAIGRGVVDDRWLGVTAVAVAPEARRRGLATQIMRALWTWGRGQGATRSYLQVEADNDAAVALYRTLGYAVHHDYQYRLEPASGS